MHMLLQFHCQPVQLKQQTQPHQTTLRLSSTPHAASFMADTSSYIS
jgi:hypothetical protein